MKAGDKNRPPAPAELLRHFIELQDEKFDGIARRLHDDFGQQLAAIGILLSTLKRRVPPGDSESLEQIERTRQKIVALGEGMRGLSNELHSSILEHAGLAIALRAYCADLSARRGAQISFESDGEFEGVSPRIARNLYRIAQEALRGIAENRGAGVRVSISDRAVHLAIRSSGALSVFPMGLATLRQRAKSIGATARLKPTELIVSAPLNA